jgi:hypothetical protein
MGTAQVPALCIDAQFQTIAEPDEGVARQPLAALDAFQQESRPEGRQLQVRRNRRVQIRCNIKRSLHLENLRSFSPTNATDNKKPITTI